MRYPRKVRCGIAQTFCPGVEQFSAVLGSATRTFSAVLAAANQILQRTFGMELVEMQAMPTDKDMSEKDADLLKTTGVKKKCK